MEIFAGFRAAFPALCCEENFSFAKHTTIGCGGWADVAVFPKNAVEASEVLKFLRREKIPYCILGAGANLLPPDERYEGVVLSLTRMRSLRQTENSVFADAGCTGAELLSFSKERGLSGFEPFKGIPMTVGGAVAMNAGVPEAHIGDSVKRVLVADGTSLRILSSKDCMFSEKSSIFTGELLLLRAELAFSKAEKSVIEEREKFFLEKRSRLPKGRSMGCTFVNPKDIPAGALIEVCGLKGKRIGGAYVSTRHANFIINEGTRAQDVQELIDYIRTYVYERTGILLREEIRRLSSS